MAVGAEAPPGFAGQLIAIGERLSSAARSLIHEIASRRGMPLAVAGIVVLVLAWLSERDSAWGFPMLITGLALVGLGLVGPRLSGSMALRWGEDGAHFHLHSTVAPPGERRRAPEVPALPGAEDSESPAVAEPMPPVVPPSEIEGSAETIEFSVEALGRAQDESAG